MLTVIIGRTASGKTTFAEELAKLNMKYEVSYSTKEPRNKNDTSHHFVSEQEFDELEDKILETSYNGKKYAYTKNQLNQAECIVLDPKGMNELLNLMPNLEIFIVNIIVDEEKRKQNFLKRENEKSKEEVLALFQKRNEEEFFMFNNVEKKIDKWQETINQDNCIQCTGFINVHNVYGMEDFRNEAMRYKNNIILARELLPFIEIAKANDIINTHESDPEKCSVAWKTSTSDKVIFYGLSPFAFAFGAGSDRQLLRELMVDVLITIGQQKEEMLGNEYKKTNL